MSRIVKAITEHKLQIIAHAYIALTIFMFTESALGTLLIAPIALVAYVSVVEELTGDNVVEVIVVKLPDGVKNLQAVAEALAEEISEDANLPVKLVTLDIDEVNEISANLTDKD